MVSVFEILSPSFLLFPALLGSAILALVCPLVGAHLILRRRIFLGLTLPQIAASGVALTFWIYHYAGFVHGHGGERLLAVAGSLLCTFLGMGLLAYLDRRATGSPEGRLAAAYALASAVTILFVVFNPAGELEILNLLKGEVIAISSAETNLLATVYGIVLLGLVVFRREFLLTSFDPDLAFLLTGGGVQWNALLYLLCGLSIAVGVIMAGPLLVFGFMVLPPLSARPFARGIASFFALSSLIGLLTALLGFYLSILLDLPLGPTDVAVGCLLLFVCHALNRARNRRAVAAVALCVVAASAGVSCSQTQRQAAPLSSVAVLGKETVWLARPRNSSGSELRLPGANPLRSLAEMAGKVSSDYRSTVMDLLREELQAQLAQKNVRSALPETLDARLTGFPGDPQSAARTAREGKLSGVILIADILRWDGEAQKFVRVTADFKLIGIADGAIVWQTRVQRAVPTTSATNLGQAYVDAVKAVVQEIVGF